MNITKAMVEHVKSPRSGQTLIRDDKLTGFGVRVTAQGAKSFIFEGRIKGRVRRITAGQYPAMTVMHARQRVLEIKTAIARGEDPAEERKAERGEPSFGDLADRYIEQHAKPHKVSWARDAARLKAHFSRWRTRRLGDISRDEVIRCQQAIAFEHGNIASNRAIVLLRAMFNKAAEWGMWTGPNPANKLDMYHEEKRERFLSPKELLRVNEALIQEPDPSWRAYFPLVLLLGVRRNELLGARWADIDLDEATIRIPHTKAGRSHLLPLPADAVEIMRQLPSRETSLWVFPGVGKTGHLIEVKSAWQRIRQRAGVNDVTVHDLRRTFGSWLAGAGHSLPLIGKALNHRSVASTQIYARLDLKPVRDAMERNAQAMQLGLPSE